MFVPCDVINTKPTSTLCICCNISTHHLLTFFSFTQVNYLLMVALASGELCIYRDLSMIHSFKVDAPVAALCYGTYGREENALIAVHGQVCESGVYLCVFCILFVGKV